MTVQSLGYKFTVSEQFRERIELCINSGQIPEKKLRCIHTDNSENDPITGPTVDIVYEVFMPVVVKEERVDDEDNDLKVLGVTLAPRLPLQSLSIKDGKVVQPEHSAVLEPKTTSEKDKEEKSAEKSEEKMPDVGSKASKLHPADKAAEDGQADDTPEKQPGSQTPAKKGRKRSADSDNKTDKCESEEESKSNPKKRKKTAAAPGLTAMSLRNRDRPAK